MSLNSKEPELQRLRIGPEKLGLKFPILTYDVDSGLLILRQGAMSVQDLDAALRIGISIPPDVSPMGYIPYDCDSSDDDIADALIAGILKLLLAGRGRRFYVVDLLRGSYAGYYNYLSPNAKKQLTARIAGIVADLSAHEFSGFF